MHIVRWNNNNNNKNNNNNNNNNNNDNNNRVLSKSVDRWKSEQLFLTVSLKRGDFFQLCRLDRVYYGNRLDDTKHVLDLAPLFQHVASPIDQRSTTVEKIRGKKAYDVITKWANDSNLKDHLLTKLGS